MPKGARHNCSSACSQEWAGRTSPSRMRYLVRQRDKGICAACGLDCLALRAEYDALVKKEHGVTWNDTEAKRVFRKQHGIPPGRSCGDFWDADHIVPVVEGGGECRLSNFRTLCIPCHKRETAELARRRAHERHVKKPLPLFDQVGA